MVQSLLVERVDERAHHVFLPDEFGEGARTPLAGENLGHGERAETG
jgi:hypothetical protein